MLAVNQLVGFGAGYQEVDVSQVASGTDETDLTTYSWASQSFGAEDPLRYLVGGFTGNTTTLGRTIASASIGGVAASEVCQNNVVGARSQPTGLFIAFVPTGTTGTVSVTFSGAMSRGAFVLWRVTGIRGNAFDTSNNQTGDPVSDTLDIPALGAAIGVVGSNSNPTWTWTNLTENVDDNSLGSMSFSGASKKFITTQSGLTITADPSAAVDTALALASWGPIM